MTSKHSKPSDTAVSSKLPDHVSENRYFWDEYAPEWIASGERSWVDTEPSWGMWGVAESILGLLPEDMSSMRAIELGCGTGYVSAWMARRGATVVGIDNSSRQLATARRLMKEHGLELTLIHGNAENVLYPDASFDFAISEYGAATWCDPYGWIPEAHRVLKPGGKLVMLGSHPFVTVCTPANGANADRQLHAPYFGMHAQDWRDVEIDPGGIEFNLTISDWMKLFRDTGFSVEEYHELQAPADTPDVRFTVLGDWARLWPSEQVWVLSKHSPRDTLTPVGDRFLTTFSDCSVAED